MTSSKGEGSPAAAQSNIECCMCGDHGLSFELFRCKSCQFRSQHRYCSSLYPKAESYRLCNWCLTEKDNSSNSSSSCKVKTDGDRKIKNEKLAPPSHHQQQNEKNICKAGSSPEGRKGTFKLPVKNNNNNNQVNVSKEKKTVTAEQSPSLVARKRIAAAGGGIAERMRRTKSESGIIKHVFRNKVRRYKLLEEVSS